MQRPFVDEMDHEAGEYIVTTPFHYVETRQDEQELYAGWARHELVLIDGTLKIQLKRIDLVNCEAAFGNIQLLCDCMLEIHSQASVYSAFKAVAEAHLERAYQLVVNETAERYGIAAGILTYADALARVEQLVERYGSAGVAADIGSCWHSITALSSSCSSLRSMHLALA